MRQYIETKEFHKISPHDAADVFVKLLEGHGIKVIASDFDSTMIAKHSGGFCDPKEDIDVLSSVTAHFKAVGERLKKSNIKLVVVTFSDDSHVKNHPVYISGARMVKKALEHSNCAANIEKVYDFYPRFWSEPSQYTQLGLAAPMPRHKEYHLNQVCHDFNVQMSEIVLIDDDIHNCKNAKKIGAAVLYVKGAGFDLTEVDLI